MPVLPYIAEQTVIVQGQSAQNNVAPNNMYNNYNNQNQYSQPPNFNQGNNINYQQNQGFSPNQNGVIYNNQNNQRMNNQGFNPIPPPISNENVGK